MLTALFGIGNGSLNLVVNLLILTLVVIWLALIYWTWADARRRIGDSVLVTTATAASLFPFIGTIVYTILRPPEFLADVRERDLDVQASELRLRHLTAQSCPRCEHPIERIWLRCPECQTHLKDPCRSCGKPVDPRWAICPYCEAPVAPSDRKREPSPRREKPRAAASEQRGGSSRGEAAKRARSERPAPRAEKPQAKPRSERAERPKQRQQEAKSKAPPAAAGNTDRDLQTGAEANDASEGSREPDTAVSKTSSRRRSATQS